MPQQLNDFNLARLERNHTGTLSHHPTKQIPKYQLTITPYTPPEESQTKLPEITRCLHLQTNFLALSSKVISKPFKPKW